MSTLKIPVGEPMLDAVQAFSALQVLVLNVPSLQPMISDQPGVPQHSLESDYRAQLKRFWSGTCPDIGVELTGSCRDVFVALQRTAAQAQARWLRDERLESLLGDKDGKGSHWLECSASRRSLRLPLLVLIPPEHAHGSPDYAAWLMSSDSILRRFSSERALKDEIARQMLQPEQQEVLLTQLSSAERQAVRDDEGHWAADRFSLVPCKDGLFEERVQRLLDVQDVDVAALVAAIKQQALLDEPLQLACEHLARLNGFAKAQARQMERLLDQHRRKLQPQWLKSADETMLQAFAERGQRQAAKRKALDELLAETMTPQAYAQHILKLELSSFQIKLDPAKVHMKVAYDFRLKDRALPFQKDVTLVQLALNDHFDQPVSTQTSLILDPKDKAAGLTEQVVRKIIEAHDIRGYYGEALQARYATPEVRQTMHQLLDERFGLALLAARMQGVVDPAVFAQIEGLRQSTDTLASKRCTVHWVAFGDGEIPLTDLIVLSYPVADGESFLLYAPGSHNGEDVRVFHHVTALRNELGSWIATPSGRDYLLGQTSAALRENLASCMEQLRLKPVLIDARSIRIYADKAATWAGLLSTVCGRQAEHQLAEVSDLTPDWYLKPGLNPRRNLTRIDAELQALTHEYARITHIPTYQDFAHARLQKEFDENMPPYRARIDVRQHRLEIGPGKWKSLVAISMSGVDRGVDVSSLPVSGYLSREQREIIASIMAAFLEKNDLPTAYSRVLETAFLKAHSPDREWRQDVYFRMGQLDMQRARLLGSMNKSIDAKRNVFLMRTINNLDRLESVGPLPEGGTKSGLYTLAVKGEPVQGVYVFREAVAGRYVDTLYTPDAPDGIGFRDISKFAESIEKGAMGPYYRERVPFRHLARFDRFLEKLENEGYSSSFTESRVGPFSRVGDFRFEHDRLIHGLLQEVDASTLSKGERFSKLIIERALQVLSVASLPFPPAKAILSGLLVARSLFLGVHAYHRAERAVAAWHLLDAALGVASLAGVAGKPNALFMQALFKGPPPKLVGKMVSKLQDELTGQLRGYLESISLPEPDSRYAVN